MAIKVQFPAGASNAVIKGLYQWDYGQVLEIESADIGTEIVEVHFACPSMSEAIVRSCSFSNNVGTVTIPDICLEQSSPVTAWIYRISGTQGHTWKTISISITARTRPAGSRDIPQDFSDKYTELLTEVNEVIDSLEKGNITAACAQNASRADYAAAAGNAQSASHAVSAESAASATTAMELNANETIVGTVGTSGKKVSMTRGKVYMLAFRYSEETDANYRDNVFLYVPSAWDNTTSTRADSAYSTVSRHSLVARYAGGTTLYFENASGTTKKIYDVVIREI